MSDDYQLIVARQRFSDGIGMIAGSGILIVHREWRSEPGVTEIA